ncbi:DinB family protein, partial [Salisaeta longa]|uniref:DinB family protein n=1 Tax=Salisaeta longa TaxID=503170 RepID=UPI0003B52AA5
TGLPHSGWELVEHLRIAQRDILDFCQADAYEQPAWPDDYWPAAAAPPSENAWHDSLQQIRDDHAALCTLVRDTPDLMAVVPHGETQTFLREALLVADHNAYHLGQLVDVRRALDCWPPEADDAA